MKEKEIDDDTIKGILLYLLDEKLLETRVNEKTKKQEFAITDKGHDVKKVLKIFGGDEKWQVIQKPTEGYVCGCKECGCRAKVKIEEQVCDACSQGLHDKFKKE